MPKVYPPGTRKKGKYVNRKWVVKGHFDGESHEIATDAKNARGAVNAWDAFKSEYRKGAKSRPRAAETFRSVAVSYKATRRVSRNEERYLDKLCEVWIDGEDQPLGDILIGDVKPMHLGAAAARLHPNSKPQTINRQVYTPAASVLHFAEENGLRPYLVVKKLREPDSAPRRPAKIARATLIGATTGKQRAFLTLLFYQGWRVTETLGLLAERVKLKERTFELYVRKAQTWKPIPMQEASFEVLANLGLPDAGRVFAEWRDRHDVYDWLGPLCEELEIAFTPHQARWEFAGALREKRATNRDIMDLGTWTSEKSVARYTEAPLDHTRALLSSIYDEPEKTVSETVSKTASG